MEFALISGISRWQGRQWRSQIISPSIDVLEMDTRLALCKAIAMHTRRAHLYCVDTIVVDFTRQKDNLMDADRAPTRSGAEVRQAAAAFAHPITGHGVLQLLTSFGPFIAVCTAMYLVFPISYLFTLALALPAGALLVRILYRLPRHPLVANMLLPPLVFLVLYRMPLDTPRRWVRERRSVHLTNAALVALFGALVMLLGWQEVLMVHLPVMVVASILGVWLFSLQHRFEMARRTRREEWNASDASMEGLSWFDLPRVLHWLTGNIGFHHVHHLNPRVPNYRLCAAHDAVQAVWPVQPLSLMDGIRALWLTLWDETSERLVSFRTADRSLA